MKFITEITRKTLKLHGETKQLLKFIKIIDDLLKYVAE